jgi:alpha-ketoglutarate-dependent taurine dioxygenase
MQRALALEPLDATFGAIVHDLRLTALETADWAALHDAWLDHALLIFPGQHLSRTEQIEFAKRFGALEFEMAAISNVRSDGSLRDESANDDVMKILKGNMGWHADSTYMPVQAKGAVFSAEIVPTVGGQTGFADMRAAYDALDDERRAMVDRLSASHSLYYSQSKLDQVVEHPGRVGDYSGYGFHDGPVPRRPLVKVHPETGRRSLAIGRHAHNIPGMDAKASEEFLQELVDFACEARRVYHHDWAPGDTVVWDNRCLLHRATPWDMRQPRVMWHSRIAGDPLTEAALPEPAPA